MRRWGLAAFPLTLPFPPWTCGGDSRADTSHAVHAFPDQVCEHLPPEGP